MAKIYLAAQYSQQEKMRQWASTLIILGHTITSRWIKNEKDVGTQQELSDWARIDLDDIDAADVIISQTFTRGDPSVIGGGRHVEYGYALAMGKFCINIGGIENVFQALPGTKTFSSFDSFIAHEAHILDHLPANYQSLAIANKVRDKEWNPENLLTLAFRGNELAGEVGEACNVIKKIERQRLGIGGSRDTLEHLAEELADVVICSYLTAMEAGIDLDKAVVEKFNATSEKMGLKTRMVHRSR